MKAQVRRIRKSVTGWVRRHYDYQHSRRHGRRGEEVHQNLHTFCLFIGYPRSGHSLVGSLLDAHPNIVIAHELNALKYFRDGFDRSQLFYLLLKNAGKASEGGRGTAGYSFDVPGQWQGRFSELHVIGDKKGGGSSRILMDDPTAIERFRKFIGVDLKVVHVVRNPFDNIATRARRLRHRFNMDVRPVDLEDSVAFYFDRAKVNDAVARASNVDVLHFRQEDLIEEPKVALGALCSFLGIEATPEYLEACASIVFKKPHQTRDDVEWPDALRARIEEEIRKRDFLTGYSFED